MNKHTPGPWRLTNGDVDVAVDYNSPGYYSNLRIVGQSGDLVVGCDEYDVFGWDPHRAADIHLLLAAPDLLRELQVLVGLCEVWAERGVLNRSISILDAARAAIAKATGAA